MDFVASVATKDGEGEASFLGLFEAKVAALESTPVLFSAELPPRVFTMLMVWAKHKQKLTKKDERKNKSFERQAQRN